MQNLNIKMISIPTSYSAIIECRGKLLKSTDNRSRMYLCCFQSCENYLNGSKVPSRLSPTLNRSCLQGEICKDISIQGLSLYLNSGHPSLEERPSLQNATADDSPTDTAKYLEGTKDLDFLIHPFSIHARIGLNTGGCFS